MNSRIELGAVFQHDSSENPLRVIAFDDSVVMYDVWWPDINAWGMTNLAGKYSYYRLLREDFETRMRYLRTEKYSEAEHKVHRPDLPFSFAQHKALTWYRERPSSVADLDRQLLCIQASDLKGESVLLLAAHAIYLAPFGPKGRIKPMTLVSARDGQAFTQSEILWRAWQLQEPYLREHQVTKGVGIHRLGIQRRTPTYYIWGAASMLDALPEAP